MLLIAWMGVAAADIVVPDRPAPEECHVDRCAGDEARECVTTLGELPDCPWITPDWHRACLRKAGAQAVHVMCRSKATPAPAEAPPTPVQPAGCGCASATAPPTAVGALLLLLLRPRRRGTPAGSRSRP